MVQICEYCKHFNFLEIIMLLDAFKAAILAMENIDIVVNNAGILDERRWEREIVVNIVS